MIKKKLPLLLLLVFLVAACLPNSDLQTDTPFPTNTTAVTDTSVLPTATAVPTETPTLIIIPTKTTVPVTYFDLQENKGLYLAALVDQTIKIYTIEGEEESPLYHLENYVFFPSFDNGRMIYTTGNDILLVDLNFNEKKQVSIFPNEKTNHPVFFSGTNQILFSSTRIKLDQNTGQVNEFSELFYLNIGESEKPEPVFDQFPGNIFNADISNDGKFVVFESDKDRLYRTTDLYLLNTNCLFTNTTCDHQFVKITNEKDANSAKNPSWSPSGEKIVYECVIHEIIKDENEQDVEILQADLCLLDLVDHSIKNITNTRYVSEGFPRWSPDNHWIGYSANYYDETFEGYVDEIFLIDPKTNETIKITNTSDIDEWFLFWIGLD